MVLASNWVHIWSSFDASISWSVLLLAHFSASSISSVCFLGNIQDSLFLTNFAVTIFQPISALRNGAMSKNVNPVMKILAIIR